MSSPDSTDQPEVTAAERRGVAQRRRTRRDIVAATMGLLADGRTPSIGEIAEAADVSRRTVYLHFPTLDQLLIDATLGLIDQSTGPRQPAVDGGSADPAARIEALIRSVQQMTVDTEALGRSLLRLTLDAPAGAGPRRGYRRVGWIEDALAPLRGELDDERFERLVSALTLLIGWEALIVLRDTRGLEPGEAEEVSVWAARALVAAALEEAGQPAAPPVTPPAT